MSFFSLFFIGIFSLFSLRKITKKERKETKFRFNKTKIRFTKTKFPYASFGSIARSASCQYL